MLAFELKGYSVLCLWSGSHFFCQGLEKVCGKGDISQIKDALIQSDLQQ